MRNTAISPIQVWMPKGLKVRFKAACAQQRRTMSGQSIVLIEHFVQQMEALADLDAAAPMTEQDAAACLEGEE